MSGKMVLSPEPPEPLLLGIFLFSGVPASFLPLNFCRKSTGDTELKVEQLGEPAGLLVREVSSSASALGRFGAGGVGGNRGEFQTGGIRRRSERG